MPSKIDSSNPHCISMGNYCHAPYYKKDSFHINAISNWCVEKKIKKCFLDFIFSSIGKDDRTWKFTAAQIAKQAGVSIRYAQDFVKQGLATGAFIKYSDHNRGRRRASVYCLGYDAPLWSNFDNDEFKPFRANKMFALLKSKDYSGSTLPVECPSDPPPSEEQIIHSDQETKGFCENGETKDENKEDTSYKPAWGPTKGRPGGTGEGTGESGTGSPMAGTGNISGGSTSQGKGALKPANHRGTGRAPALGSAQGCPARSEKRPQEAPKPPGRVKPSAESPAALKRKYEDSLLTDDAKAVMEFLKKETQASPGGARKVTLAALSQGRISRLLDALPLAVPWLHSQDWIEDKTGFLCAIVEKPKNERRFWRSLREKERKPWRSEEKAQRKQFGCKCQHCGGDGYVIPEMNLFDLKYAKWRNYKDNLPNSDSPAYMDRLEEERKAFHDFITEAVKRVNDTEKIKNVLRIKLLEAGIMENTLVWKRAWDHHYPRLICEELRISL